jgi:hypothetical protein
VAHDNPVEHRYHAMMLFGLKNREALDVLLKTTQVTKVVDDQARVLTAVHAYSIERTVPVIRANAQ